MAASAPITSAIRATLEPPGKALGPDESDQEIRGEYEGVLERRRQVDDGHALDHPNEERGEQRAQDAAEAAERDDGVGQHGELQADLRIDGEEIDQNRARDGHQPSAQAPGYREHALRPDADEPGGVAVLAGGLQGQPELRTLDEQIERQEEQQRQPGGEKQGHREREPEQGELGAAEPQEEAVVDEAVVAG